MEGEREIVSKAQIPRAAKYKGIKVVRRIGVNVQTSDDINVEWDKESKSRNLKSNIPNVIMSRYRLTRWSF